MRTSGKVMFAKPQKNKVNKYLHDRRSTLTDEEILKIRKELNITPKDPSDTRGFPNAYEKGM